MRDGRIFGAAAPQPSTGYDPAHGSDDCLYLNVDKPAGPSGSEPLPVMVWVHGSGFVTGSGNAFMGGALGQTACAVIVTVNYRLGPPGWLALPRLGGGLIAGAVRAVQGCRVRRIEVSCVQQ